SIQFDRDKTIISPEDARSMAFLEAENPINDRILELIEAQNKVSPRTLATALGINISEARSRLTSLVRAGKVEQTRDGFYIINTGG
ncbi:MAG: DUF4423 domain-containing protein, partial [Bdellovibrionaceae bacterium]|nr:DUF4423 domain-containing protein [Pseudobdellovibrionaceae bacterium]